MTVPTVQTRVPLRGKGLYGLLIIKPDNRNKLLSVLGQPGQRPLYLEQDYKISCENIVIIDYKLFLRSLT